MIRKGHRGGFALLVVVAGTILWGSVGPASAQVVERRDSVDGTLSVAPPCDPPACSAQPRYSFRAVTEADGSGPQGSISYSTGERQSVFTISGDVTCARVSGNRATLAANMDESLNSPGQPSQSVIVFLEDNGPATADRWLVRQVPLGTAPSSCPADPPPGTALGPGYGGGASDPGVMIVDRRQGPIFKVQCRNLGWLGLGFASRADCEAFVIRTRALAGSIRELPVPTPDSGPLAIAAGPDGAAWFTEANAGKIGRVTTSGQFREFAIPTPGSYPDSITSGPEGALWFIESLGNRFARISTSGVVKEFPEPAQGSYTDIAAGSDGALWSTGSVFGQPRSIYRMTPAGAFTTFRAGSNYSQDITAGPDGALWFTMPLVGVGRLTTAGQYTEFPVPGDGVRALGITSGPGGALWFTESQTNRIGRLTTAGQMTHLPLPAGVGSPRSIAAGADGALWFTLFNGGVGRITPSGQFTHFPLPTLDASPAEIAAGPGNSLWVTEQAGNRIVRIPSRPRNRHQCTQLGWVGLGFTSRQACQAFVQFVPRA